jgi:hypothetical protein
MARVYYIIPVSTLNLDILAKAVVSSLESLRLNDDKSEAVVKFDEKEVETCEMLDKLGFQRMTAEECRAIADTWNSPDTPLDTRAQAEIVAKSNVDVESIRASKPRLVGADIIAEAAKLDIEGVER